MAEIATGKITPIIIVHAVTAGGLHDHYPMDAERVWSPLEMTFKDYERIQLYPYEKAPRGSRFEAVEPAVIRPSEAFGLIYKDIVSELKHNLSYGPTPVQPVYPFVYDWRQDNFLSAQRLRDFVEEVIDRTNLMKHDSTKIGGAACDSVDLVGHSMGGLVISGAIVGSPADSWAATKVRRVLTLGTPFRGANAAIQKLATGGGTMFGRNAAERERTMARVTPSAYQLLPAFTNAVIDSGGAEADIFVPDTFQPSIPDTISEFVMSAIADQTIAKDKAECRRIAGEILKNLLDTAWKYHLTVEKTGPHLLRPNEGAWLAIVGVGEKTHVQTTIGKDQYGKKWFDFDAPDTFCEEQPKWKTNSGKPTGDETVPLPGATPPWTDSWKHTVVVRRSDFERFGEMGDRVLCDQLGLHSTLPLLDLAQRWAINFFRPEWAAAKSLGQHGKLWGRGLPGFQTNSPDGNPTTAELQETWRALIPGLRLSDAD